MNESGRVAAAENLPIRRKKAPSGMQNQTQFVISGLYMREISIEFI